MPTLSIMISWIIGILSIFIGLPSVYYVWKASKAYGGKLGVALFRQAIGIIFLYVFTQVIVAIIVLVQLEKTIPDYIYIPVAVFAVITNVIVLNSCRSILNSIK